jgi:hypothetical protein
VKGVPALYFREFGLIFLPFFPLKKTKNHDFCAVLGSGKKTAVSLKFVGGN